MAAKVLSTAGVRRDDNIFQSVFPRQNFTTPTPQATPNIGSTSFGQSFGGFNATDNAASDAAQVARAWSSATRYLDLSSGADAKPQQLDNDVLFSFTTLLATLSTRQNLVEWYKNQISSHVKAFVYPELQTWQQPIRLSEASVVLQTTTTTLYHAQKHYLDRLRQLADALARSNNGELRINMAKFCSAIQQSIHTLVHHSIPRQRLQKTLAAVMLQHMTVSMELHADPERCLKHGRCQCKPNLQALPLEEMSEVGLSGTTGERAFAHALHKFLERPAIERRCFAVDWSGHTSTVPRLRLWVNDCLVPFVERSLAAISGNAKMELGQVESEQFTKMAVSNMGRLRTDALFDYVKTWPASTGAVMDIWEYLSAGSQSDKAFVCQSFSEAMRKRLLHAGAMTAEVLSIYINVIHTFNALDSRGVLLEKVAVPIRNYLRSRDDTVSIIAASFLADIDTDGKVTAADMDKICSDITTAVADSALRDGRDNNKSLDWDDMHWMPDPIDAGPEYKSSKSADIISYVLGNLFEPEEFIKEVTNVLAQHLLHVTDSEYIKETRLIELFKSRLDANKLQAAEVMLKDVRDSVALGKRINPHAQYEIATKSIPTPREIQAAIPEEGITLSALYAPFETRISRPQFVAAVKLVATKRDDLFYPKRTRLPPERIPAIPRTEATDFKTQILSSYFWPQLRSNTFRLPDALVILDVYFTTNFERLGSQRKLHFRPALARMSIKLELEDRTVEEHDVPGWRASVIDAFAAERTTPSYIPYDDAAGLTVEQLTEALRMEEELVRDALHFWAGKNVLYQRAPGVYAVLERLDMDVEATQSEAQQSQQETFSAVRSEKALLQESAPTFEMFILNMLKNQGPKEVGGMMGITGLLRMVLPTFTYGDEEVRWLLGEMEKKGQVRREGERWVAI